MRPAIGVGLVALCLASACEALAPARPGLPGGSVPNQPASFRPSPGLPVAAVSPRPTAVPSAIPRPKPDAFGCPTPPPGYCCEIVFGSVQGTLTDETKAPIPGAKVVIRTSDKALLGGCSDTAASAADSGRYAFNNVPWDVGVTLQASAPGFQPFETPVSIPKGPILYVNVVLKRQ